MKISGQLNAKKEKICRLKRHVWYGKSAKSGVRREKRTGILLVHGFTGTPKEMHDCGKLLAKKGFRCLAITLSGHAGDNNDLVNIQMEDWINDIKCGVEKLKRDGCKKVWILGYSLGSPLSTHYALKNNDINGLILLAPYLSDLWLFKLGGKIFKSLENRIFIQFNLHKKYLRYTRVPLSSATQAIRAFDEIKEGTINVQVPVLMIHSECDEVVREKDSRSFFKRIKSKRKKFIIAKECTHALVIKIKESIIDKMVDFIKEYE